MFNQCIIYKLQLKNILLHSILQIRDLLEFNEENNFLDVI